MRLRYFAHSWLSDWNHGNAHFLRGLASALVRRGHEVRLYEPVPGPEGGWSLAHLLREPKGARAVEQMRRSFPELNIRLFGSTDHRASLSGVWPGHIGLASPSRWSGCGRTSLPGNARPLALRACPSCRVLTGLPWVMDWREELQGAEIVIVHEWNDPALLRWLVAERRRYGFRLLLHDTHHRAWSEAAMLERLPLADLDGVLAFGESLRQIYERTGRVRQSFTLQEAADEAHFQSGNNNRAEQDLVWIGNWGDEERTRELERYLFGPAAQVRAQTQIYGVRYPAEARRRLLAAGIGYGGYLPNLEAPGVYARARLTVHVPRAPYAAALPGIPTIRVFEAMACGMALLSAPWTDSEGLFAAGEDYWPVRDGEEMASLLGQLLANPQQRKELGRRAAATITARHTCMHRAQTLEAICHELN